MQRSPAPAPHPVVAVVGSGFSGTMVAWHLARNASAPMTIALIEERKRFGPGIAYGACEPEHLLNVPAKGMSALRDDPDHFLDFARGQRPETRGEDFVPRAVFGEYLAGLADGIRHRQGLVQVERHTTTVRRIARRGGEGTSAAVYTLALADGRSLAADAVVLALGNARGESWVSGLADNAARPRLHRAWHGTLYRSIGPSEAVLLVGSGLTMVDVALSLASSGHRGPLIALSRRGLLPRAHTAVPAARDESIVARVRGQTSALALTRIVSRAARHAGDWRAVIDGLRPETAALWATLPAAEQRRFLRHVRPFWDVHRHRVAPATGELLQRMLGTQRLTVRAGRLLALSGEPGGIAATIRSRGGPPDTLHVAHVVDCAGIDWRMSAPPPLLYGLIDAGLARADAHGLGLVTTSDGALHPREALFTLGPLCRGQRWETTAVPELRVQAETVATAVLARLSRRKRRQDETSSASF